MPDIAVSIIIPSYNRLWCLPRAVDSCRNTQCKTEIIVVDDGSTDGTWEWLQQQNDVKAIRQKNQGQTYAVNNGLAAATGKYVRFLDSDDFLVTEMINTQYLAAEAEQAELAYSGVDLYDDAAKRSAPSPALTPWTDFLAIQLGNEYGSHFLGMLFKTDWVKKVPRRPDFAFREDRMFLLEYGLMEPKTIMVEGCAGYWVQHQDQMQANYTGWKSQVTNWQHLNIYKKILGELEAAGKLTQARKNAACNVLWPLAHWIAKDFITDGQAVVDWIYRLNPNFEVPEKGSLGWLYQNIGFSKTEKLLKARRKVVAVLR